jgi:hypothetical protein
MNLTAHLPLGWPQLGRSFDYTRWAGPTLFAGLGHRASVTARMGGTDEVPRRAVFFDGIHGGACFSCSTIAPDSNSISPSSSYAGTCPKG